MPGYSRLLGRNHPPCFFIMLFFLRDEKYSSRFILFFCVFHFFYINYCPSYLCSCLIQYFPQLVQNISLAILQDTSQSIRHNQHFWNGEQPNRFETNPAGAAEQKKEASVLTQRSLILMEPVLTSAVISVSQVERRIWLLFSDNSCLRRGQMSER